MIHTDESVIYIDTPITEDIVFASDEYDAKPSHMYLRLTKADLEMIQFAHETIASNAAFKSISFYCDAGFESEEGSAYEGKVRHVELVIKQNTAYIAWINEWTDTSYTISMRNLIRAAVINQTAQQAA